MSEENIEVQVTGTPRPPTPSEIAQAILDHVATLGGEISNFSGGYKEVFTEADDLSTIEYFGPQIGHGFFYLPWPTTPLPKDEAVE